MRVLVVEDVQRLADDIAEGLRDQGMAVDVSYHGLDAVEKLNVHPYDVVVLDRNLPGLHGDEIAQLLASRQQRPMTLMLTAASDIEQRIAGLRLGVDDYLGKPFHFQELVLRVRALARRKATAHGHLLQASGLEVDTLRRTASRDGRPLDLSLKEFAVLEALLEARPGYLSSEALLDKVWDEHTDPFTKTVQVTVGRIRRKLGEPPIIHTSPGVGYRIT
jgi:DNA-binding response OmpR family regulator